tara:strand:- start:13303 stop:14097 length:795 start_codon:yes stop_codon:yes gene_type:complete
MNYDESLFKLDDSIVFLTGANGQLGCELVHALIAFGSKVVAVDLSLDLISNKIKENALDEERILTLECDITNKLEVSNAFRKGKNHFGQITGLVNNAGVSVFEPFMERSEESIDFVMDVNLKGTLFCIQEFLLSKDEDRSGGAIVSIGSHYGFISPDPRIYSDGDRRNSEIYGATKAGVIQMTKYFSVHASAHNVRVNAVSPGGIRSSENPQREEFQKKYNYRCPMGRMAETREIVGAVLYLISPAASYVNGHNLVVDGGFSAW